MNFFDQFKQSSEKNHRKREISNMVNQLLENEQEDRLLFPEDGDIWQPFLDILIDAIEEYTELAGSVDATIKFYITKDRMAAYACMLPPVGGGEKLKPRVYGEKLRESGITSCLNDELALTYLAKNNYLHIFPIAKGVRKKDGEDGRVEELFEPRPVFRIEGQDGAPIDFSELKPVQLIRRGETVCRVHPPTDGTEGIDVTGNRTPCKKGKPIEVVPGHNMLLSDDGLRIEASENGAVFLKDGETYVQTAIVRRGGIKQYDELVWLTYVDGDISENAKIESTSSIFVMGEIRGAEIHSNGSVRAQGGIRAGAKIIAKRQIIAPVIEDSCVKAGTDVYAEQILRSDVSSKGNVFVTGGEGTIKQSTVRAIEHIECNEVGEENGQPNEIVLGFYQELKDEINQLTDEYNDVQGVLEKLRKNILNLRMGGDSLPMEKRGLLSKLIEQRELYETRASEINASLKEAKEKRRSGLESVLVCNRLNPTATVQIGEHKNTFFYPENNCRFHLYAGNVMPR